MISQNCPRCGSNRVRKGYRHTSIFSKLICRFQLLCDNCNWEFVGFAVPGTVTAKPKRRKKKTDNLKENSLEVNSSSDTEVNKTLNEQTKRKKVKIKYN